MTRCRGVVGEGERDALIAACDELEAALGTGKAVLAGEDVHSAVEAALVERCGDPARRLHTGRSRNDQVATLMRIHVMRLCESAIEGVRELERALVSQAREAGDLACAAYTPLQPAQPGRLPPPGGAAPRGAPPRPAGGGAGGSA